MVPSPVQIEATPPERFSRLQLLLRFLLLVLLGALGIPAWPFGFLYLGLPIIAAVLLSTRSRERFIADDAPQLTRALGWLVELFAWFSLVTDRPPGGPERALQMTLTPGGAPTAGSALLRLVTSVPSALVLLVLGWISAIILVLAALLVLVAGRYPRSLWEYQLAMLRWQARLLAYHASLTADYPPFALDVGHEEQRRLGPHGPSPAA